MQRCEPPTGSWQDLACDMLGPMPTGEQLLVVVDYFSRYVEVSIMRSVNSRSIIKALEPMFARFGFPYSLKTDNASYFVSEEFKAFLGECGIVHVTSPPLWPQANGEVERQNRTLLKAMKAAEVEGKRWQDEINKFLLSYRSSPHSVTGVPPATLMFNRAIRTKLPQLRSEKSILFEGIRERDWREKLKSKDYVDSKRKSEFVDVKAGDQVLVKSSKTDKLSFNFEPKPWVVLSKSGNEVKVRSEEGREQVRDSSFVKKYFPSDNVQAETPNKVKDQSQDQSLVTLRRSSRVIKPPTRFEPDMYK
jgi:hypothetical protein